MPTSVDIADALIDQSWAVSPLGRVLAIMVDMVVLAIVVAFMVLAITADPLIAAVN